jgi:hypothetical protein
VIARALGGCADDDNAYVPPFDAVELGLSGKRTTFNRIRKERKRYEHG